MPKDFKSCINLLLLALAILFPSQAFPDTMVAKIPTANTPKPSVINPANGQTEQAYLQKIRALIYLKKDGDAAQLLDEFLYKLPENPSKKHAESQLAKSYAKSGNLILSYELYLRAYGFFIFFLGGSLVSFIVAGFYMGAFAIVKLFFRDKNLHDGSPKIFRPKHIFYFIFWMILIPFTFDTGLAWSLNTFHCSMDTIDLNQFCVLFFDLVLMMISLIYLRNKYKLDSKTMGFVSRGFEINVLLPLGIVMGEIVIMLIVFGIFNHLNIKIHKTPLQHMAERTLRSTTPADMLILFISMVVIGPITEEIVFRGFFYNAFKKHTSVGWAVFFSAVLFASGHDPQPFVFLILFISGVIWAIVYEKTRSLIPCMVCHMLHNLLAFASIAASVRLV